jgi:putative selenium metabolism hydrolase
VLVSVEAAVELVQRRGADIDDLLRRLVHVRSDNSQIGEICDLIEAEAQALGLERTRRDAMGNLVVESGDGPLTLLYDTHVDTVGADPEVWGFDPWEGREEDGVLNALGACDEKGSTPGMLHALAALAEVGALDDLRLVVFFNIEERAEGRSGRHLVEHEGVRPDFVLVGEPTDLRVYLGHRGRAEYALTFTGRQEHGAHADPERSAILRAARAVEELFRLEHADHPVLGRGSLAVTRIHATAGDSRNVVPGRCDVYVDRRLTLGEDARAELGRLRQLAARHGGAAELPELDEATYTGFRLEGPLAFPAWLTDDGSPLVRAALEAAGSALGRAAETGVWRFSTNGVYWAGEAGIPTVGFGPGDERVAHTPQDRVAFADVRAAAEVYTLLPAALLAGVERR